MACILKLPLSNEKGALSFTTPERDRLIYKEVRLREQVERLKDRWLIGLHHNWHDHRFEYDPLFDFSMAGEGDLLERRQTKFSLITQDACNFVPDFFDQQERTQFWDILYVARAVYFKRIPEFFQCVRKLYDQGRNYRILFICPIPPYRRADRKTAFYDIRKVYDSMFTESEKNFFSLLTLDYRYPFPFDLPTLAHFYRSSRVFVHFADDERRCRVAAYAWASGLPVIGMSCVGSLLEEKFRREPIFYEVMRDDGFPSAIERALSLSREPQDFAEVKKQFLKSFNCPVLKENLKRLAEKKGWKLGDGGYFLENLDIRLGRHIGMGGGPNHIDMGFSTFLEIVEKRGDDWARLMNQVQDPEVFLEGKSDGEQSNKKVASKLLKRIGL